MAETTSKVHTSPVELSSSSINRTNKKRKGSMIESNPVDEEEPAPEAEVAEVSWTDCYFKISFLISIYLKGKCYEINCQGVQNGQQENKY